jgi:hypothetical protein
MFSVSHPLSDLGSVLADQLGGTVYVRFSVMMIEDAIVWIAIAHVHGNGRVGQWTVEGSAGRYERQGPGGRRHEQRSV